jgi:hypothetical protein
MVKKTLIGLMVASAATLAVAAPASAEEARWGLTQEVEPGGLVTAQTLARNDCGLSPVTSKGFTAPLQWTEGGNYGVIRGHTTAIKIPGKYTATLKCRDGRVTTASFTILGTPPTKPKPPKPAKPQVAVKPAGAPRTGDGSLG